MVLSNPSFIRLSASLIKNWSALCISAVAGTCGASVSAIVRRRVGRLSIRWRQFLLASLRARAERRQAQAEVERAVREVRCRRQAQELFKPFFGD